LNARLNGPFFRTGRSHWAHWAGLSVRALIALMNAVAAIVRANWR